MPQNELKVYLEDMQADFLAGRLEDLVARLSVPLVVYSVAGVVVFRTKEEVLAQVEKYRLMIMSMAITSSEVWIVSRDAVLNNRLRLTARFTDLNANGVVVTRSLVRYFLIVENGSYKVEMIEYLEAPFPTAVIEDLIH